VFKIFRCVSFKVVFCFIPQPFTHVIAMHIYRLFYILFIWDRFEFFAFKLELVLGFKGKFLRLVEI